ncbi:MAG: 5'/3'-nucleotidase SurE [Rhodospirillales bacterium]|nr:MAG: 5'/3'-nucleotidase SurE [Rhodospirillales bacterium]
MFKPPLDLSCARILVTNDDGINAPGLRVLERVARDFSADVWVVAPETEQSGAGHSLTLSRPLRHRHLGGQRHAVSGSPTDCVLFAIAHVLEGRKPDLVLSGVNRGGNLGEDITYSGTVAAAMEATLLGVPAIAFSQVTGALKQPVHWGTAERHAPDILRRLTSVAWPKDVFMNVNFPNQLADQTGEIRFVAQGRRESDYNLIKLTDPRGNDYYWIGPQSVGELLRQDDTDYHAIEDGAVSVTPLHVDLTHNETLRRLREALE